MTERRDVTLILEIIASEPITHGAGARGNEQILATRKVLVPVTGPDGLTRRIPMEVPMVSGASVKACLREAACNVWLDALGIEALDPEQLRLIQKGGRLQGGGGASESLGELRRMVHLAPLISVFGCMDNAGTRPGFIRVGDCYPYAEETIAGGVVIPVHRADDGTEIRPHAREVPVQIAQVRTVVQHYRHDGRSSLLGVRALPAEVHLQIAEDRAAVPAKAATDERRAANESMPYAYQAIAAGTPLVCKIRLLGANPVERAVLSTALRRWIVDGAHLGGGSSRGHCSVRILGFSSEPIGDHGVSPMGTGTAIDVEGGDIDARILATHAALVRDEAVPWLLGQETPKEAAPAKPKGKRGKVEAAA